MPVFGARMVCESGNYRQVQERHRLDLQRETDLGRWVSEKSRRKAALRELQRLTRRAESIKTAKTDGVENPAPPEVSLSDGRRRSNSLVTELVSGPEHPLDLLRMESCGNILERMPRRGSDSPAQSKLLETPSLSRNQSTNSLCDFEKKIVDQD